MSINLNLFICVFHLLKLEFSFMMTHSNVANFKPILWLASIPALRLEGTVAISSSIRSSRTEFGGTAQTSEHAPLACGTETLQGGTPAMRTPTALYTPAHTCTGSFPASPGQRLSGRFCAHFRSSADRPVRPFSRGASSSAAAGPFSLFKEPLPTPGRVSGFGFLGALLYDTLPGKSEARFSPLSGAVVPAHRPPGLDARWVFATAISADGV